MWRSRIDLCHRAKIALWRKVDDQPAKGRKNLRRRRCCPVSLCAGEKTVTFPSSVTENRHGIGCTFLSNTNHNKFIHGKDVHLWMIKYQSRHLKKCYLLDEVSGPEDKFSIINQLESGLSNGCIFSFNVELFFTSFRYIVEI